MTDRTDGEGKMLSEITGAGGISRLDEPRGPGALAGRFAAALLGSVLWAGTGSITHAQDETTALEDIAAILESRGVANRVESQEVSRKARSEARRSASRLLEGVDVSADLLTRYETFLFDRDRTGVEASTRTRFQYQLRFGLTKQLNDRLRVGIRLSSGNGLNRSTTRSFGDADTDSFGPDALQIDRAFVDFTVQQSETGRTQLSFGRVAVPFFAPVPDLLIFDSDLNLEGAYLTTRQAISARTAVHATVGGFIVDEVADGADSKMYAAQLGFDTRLSPALAFGWRASGYFFRNLSDQVLGTSMFFGNLPTAFDDRAADVGETLAYARLALNETWPVTVYAQAAKNFKAERGTVAGIRVEEEDLTFGYGFVAGNPTKVALIGLGYYEAEANAVPQFLPPGTTFDLVSNRRGVFGFVRRSLNPFTSFVLSYADSSEVTSRGRAMGPFAMSLANGNRGRLVADFIFAF